MTQKRCNLNRDLWCINVNDSIIFCRFWRDRKSTPESKSVFLTHPLDLDELAEADRKRLMCWALGSCLLAGVDIDRAALVPCEDQTLAAADIDQTVTSCLEGKQ